jgi:outer membrane receptor protein involved in Fe transport
VRSWAFRGSCCAVLLALLAGPLAAAAQPTTISGVVLDVSGAPVPGATVTAAMLDGTTLEATTDGLGRFTFTGVSARLQILTDGFERVEVAADSGRPITVVLRPATFADSVVVTATRSDERLQSASSATVLASAELANMAAGALDDALRQTPGFSLFRRSSSRVANPTAQGVTLRGLSGSGASRTLVLADGAPLNDPFGTWVYWNRIPQAAVDRVEVVRGAAGDLYGGGALGGVAQVLTVQPDRTRVRAVVDGGSHGTFRGSFFAGGRKNGWAGAGSYEGVTTAGVYVVAAEDRGPVDTRANSRYHTGALTGGRQADTWHARATGAWYTEDRGNGTPLQVNGTDWWQFSADMGAAVASGALQVRVAASTQDYDQSFSAITPSRASERLTTEQTIDTKHTTVNGQWARSFGRATLVAGGDYRHTDSTVTEYRYSITNVQSGPFLAGGIETLGAAYARATVQAGDAVTLELGGRGDWWGSEPTDATLPTKSVGFFSPRASVAFRRGHYAVQVVVSRATRTPSLNELHRGFRVGNVVTNPNPLLDPETLTSVEGGALVRWTRLSVRATAFFNDLDEAIANATISSTPTQITRQRGNSDTIRAAGVELEADARLSPALSLSGQIVFTSSHFRDSIANPAIEGNAVPQVPAVLGALSLTRTDPRFVTAATQVRFSSRQFDDDLNSFVLGAYGAWDAQVSRPVTAGITAFVAVENILDTEFDTARTPQRQIGWPRTVRVGVRATWR